MATRLSTVTMLLLCSLVFFHRQQTSVAGALHGFYGLPLPSSWSTFHSQGWTEFASFLTQRVLFYLFFHWVCTDFGLVQRACTCQVFFILPGSICFSPDAMAGAQGHNNPFAHSRARLAQGSTAHSPCLNCSALRVHLPHFAVLSVLLV